MPCHYGNQLIFLLSRRMVFSILVPLYTTVTFDAGRQASLCSALTAGWVAANGATSCTVGSVTSFNGTGVLVSGYAYFTWSVTPSVINLNAATTLRDNRVTALNTDFASVIGSAFPGATPNCACNGLDLVTQSSTTAYSYSVNILGVPGPMQCGARLTYDSSIATSIINQVGVDDGTIIPANLGKFCSNPAVSNGVLGIPGVGSCRQYGVIATAAGATQAVVNNAAGNGVTITSGALTSVTFVGGNPGAGYSTAPTVTVSAANPLGATVTYTLTAGAQPSGLATATTTSFTPAVNGPYSGVPLGTLSGGVCVDVGSGGGASAVCTGAPTPITDAAGVSRTGRRCISDDFNAAATCGAPGSLGACIFITGTVITKVLFPGSATTYCTAVPVLDLATNNLQLPVTAQVSAIVGANGIISSLLVNSGGSGYRTNPTVTITAPTSDQLGKLCSINPITSLSNTIAYGASISAGVTTTGQCRPMGRNTFTNRVCSIPAVFGGEYNPLDIFTCNVVSNFIPQPGSTVTNATCGILAQSFTATVPTSPSPSPSPTPSPTPTPTPTPSPTPTPTPTSTPNPTPSPTSTPSSRKCTYDGNYRLESYGCSGQYITFDIGSAAECQNTTVLLRTGRQAPGLENQWKLKASYVFGKNPTEAPILALGRIVSRSCKKYGATNLAPMNERPWLRLGGNAFKLKIRPVDEYKTCNLVTIQAMNGNFAGSYLGYKAPCSNQANWLWGTKTKSSSMQWVLKRVS